MSRLWGWLKGAWLGADGIIQREEDAERCLHGETAPHFLEDLGDPGLYHLCLGTHDLR